MIMNMKYNGNSGCMQNHWPEAPQHASCYLSETSNALTGEPNFFTTVQRSKRFQIWIRIFSELEKVHVNFFEFVNPV